MRNIMWCVWAFLGLMMTACTGQAAKTTNDKDSTAVATVEVADSFYRIIGFYTVNEEIDGPIFEKMGNQFIETCSKDEGLVSTDFLKSVTNPMKYVFVETFTTEEIMENHINKYSAIYASEMEKLGYRDTKLVRQPSQDHGNGWYINILATIDPANLEQLIPMMTTMSLNSQAEERCNGYEFFVSVLDNSRIFLYEDWPDKEASDFHRATDNFQNNFPPIRELFKDYKVDRLYR